MKTYPLNELNNAALADVATILHEPKQPTFWDGLGARELNEHDRGALCLLTEKILQYKTQRLNEATLWARAIYPLLALAERDPILAWSAVPLSATFGDFEIRGEADGALASSIDEELGLPYLVVIEAKRGVGARDPMAQLLGAMLCAARTNEREGHPAGEIFGCYTIADVWTLLRGRLDWSQPKPVMSVLSSREYMEKVEAAIILSILGSIVAKIHL
jgi:hypothetical protein